ncbi:MAG: hypothetical protein Q4E50_01775 [Tissierellia bacterium]|nr:hypothetical protein [Tissierellia bacterium]
MKIEFDKTIIDLGFTPVENMFIHTYLSLANGNQIKVYLYALSQAYNTNGQGLTNENIAFEMGLTEGQVIDAWQFWIEQGLVQVRDDRYIFKSLRSGYISQMMGIEEDKEEKLVDEAFESDQVENKPFKELIENIEEFISDGKDILIKLTAKEIQIISSQIRDYKLSYDYYSYAFTLASAEVDSKNVAKLTGVIRNWVIDGATDEEKLNELLLKKAKQKEAVKESSPSKKTSKKAKSPEDDRLTREERKKLIQDRMKKKRELLRED